MDAILEKLEAELPVVEKPKEEFDLPEIPEFEGSRHKMEVLNNGELDSEGNAQDKAVPFQLKEGVQNLSFVLGIDNTDEDRIINVETLDKVSEMSEKEFSEAAILQQIGDKLSILREGEDERIITKEDLEDGPYLIPLNNKTAVEVVRFDPENNQIVLRKQKILTEAPPVPVLPPEVKRNWRQKFIDLLVPVAIAGSTLIGSHDANISESVPYVSPAKVPPAQPFEVSFSNESREVQGPQKQEVDASLQCETTVDFTFEDGDFLTKALVDVNGWDRYVDGEGNINVDKLYEDLACMLALPENREQIRATDPTAANFIDNIFSDEAKKILGTPTAKGVHEGLSALNRQREGSHDQLVVNQPGDHYKVPKFAK